MSMMETFPSSDEQIESRIRSLVSKIVNGTATQEERTKLQELVAKRSKSMWPSVFEKLEKTG